MDINLSKLWEVDGGGQGSLRAAVPGIAKSQIRLSNLITTVYAADYYSTLKKGNFDTCPIWMNLEDIM